MLSELIPSYYRQLIEQDASGALGKMMFFSSDELKRSSLELNDPYGEQNNQKIANLIHLYPTKVLIQTTDQCLGNCRFCFRKNWKEGRKEVDASVFSRNIAEMKNYLDTAPEVNEIVLSGGDPLMMVYKNWLELKKMLLSCEQIKTWRWHTRRPVFDPLSLPDWWWSEWRELGELGKKLVIILHLNHPAEITTELSSLVKKWHKLGMRVKAQGVLLAGVNDRTKTLTDLWQREIEFGIEPYYLHHLDRAPGTSHFWVGIEHGKRIFEEARTKMLEMWPDFNLKYMVELVNGQGKVEVEKLAKVSPLLYKAENFQGEMCEYWEGN